MRTVYDGLSFEVIREGVTFTDGSLTTRFDTGIWRPNEGSTEGQRYRWIGDESAEGSRYRWIGETEPAAARYTGISVTLYGRGEAVAVSRSASTATRGGTAYLGKDALGSVRSTTSDHGTLEDRYEYDAFGRPYAGDLSSGMNLGYTGKPYDTATGLYNYGCRDYQPAAARFTTIDPVRDGSNWFAYVNNDPVNWVDPWGLYCITNDKDAKKIDYSLMGEGFLNIQRGFYIEQQYGSEFVDASEKLKADGLLQYAVGESLVTGRTNKNGTSIIPVINVDDLPPNVRDAYKGYESVSWEGTYPGQTLGTGAHRTYYNRNGALPATDENGKAITTYKEFDVNNKIPGEDRDKERFVRDINNGTTYYTDNHYGTGNTASPRDLPDFIEIRK